MDTRKNFKRLVRQLRKSGMDYKQIEEALRLGLMGIKMNVELANLEKEHEENMQKLEERFELDKKRKELERANLNKQLDELSAEANTKHDKKARRDGRS